MDEGDRPLDRSIGLEQMFFLVEESGEPSVQADEFLERCRVRSEREGDGEAARLAPEWVKGSSRSTRHRFARSLTWKRNTRTTCAWPSARLGRSGSGSTLWADGLEDQISPA